LFQRTPHAQGRRKEEQALKKSCVKGGRERERERERKREREREKEREREREREGERAREREREGSDSSLFCSACKIVSR
jgi:hypothetical protein